MWGCNQASKCALTGMMRAQADSSGHDCCVVTWLPAVRLPDEEAPDPRVAGLCQVCWRSVQSKAYSQSVQHLAKNEDREQRGSC